MESATVSAERAPDREVTTCLHCGAPVSSGQDYCCSGCEAAHGAAASMEEGGGFAALATDNGDGSFTLTLGVEGIHCASCIRLIENALQSHEDLLEGRVNMSTERVTMRWQGVRERADALARSVTKLGYKLHALSDAETGADEQQKTLLRAIAVSGFAAANMMLISFGLWSSTAETMGMATRDLFHWVSALIALPTVLYSGRPFYLSALAALKERHTNMDVPISLAVILASGMSLVETIEHGEHVYFDSAVMLLFFLLIGRYLDARAKGKARESASQLLSRLQGFATVLSDDQTEQVPIRDLRPGMIVMVAAGQSIPADGIVVKGTSSADLSLITGETIPEDIGQGSEVFAGTLNLSAPLQVEVAKPSEKSLLSEIVRLMEVAEQGSSKYVRLADAAARLYTPVIHSLGLLTFLAWWLVLSASWQVALLHSVTVLIITCPCALGLAVPVVQVLASGRLMRRGILLKSGDALEKLSHIDSIVFDKTGTLTLGHPELIPGDYNSDHLKLAASLTAQSKHPLSVALNKAYGDALLAADVTETPGKGLSATIDGQSIKVGSRAWCGDTAIEGDANALELWLSVDDKPVACFKFADQLRGDAEATISELKARDLKLSLLSGDRKAIADGVAKETGIPEAHAEVSPVEKCDRLRELSADGHKTLMVGDGLNDAAAMAFAHVSMSPATAVDITQNTADIVFQGNELRPVAFAHATAGTAMRLVKQNFALAVIYNIIAIPLAVMGQVTPLVAAIAMSGSSMVVILNSFRLNLQKDR